MVHQNKGMSITMIYLLTLVAVFSTSVLGARIQASSSALATAKIATDSDAETGKGHHNWAVLVAGSSGYGNYRHQADVCHAYQILIKGGIPANHIITLAVDDIANSASNPYPGKIFNRPDGDDVYEGCKIDYSGTDVTPENFVKVLTGDGETNELSATTRVLKSTKKDRVFVNFVDHGGVDIIGFPRTTMHSKELIQALTDMYAKDMFKELVFYLEACESGSMFEDLPADLPIYATTAANAKESSWGTYCSPDDVVDGKKIGSCLGDLYSVNWMQDTETNIFGRDPDMTLKEQFMDVKVLTSRSHVLEFGSSSISAEHVTKFQAPTTPLPAKSSYDVMKDATSIDSRDAELHSAFNRFLASGGERDAAELIAGVQDRLDSAKRFAALVDTVQQGKPLGTANRGGKVRTDCHYAVHKAYTAKCGEWTVGALKHSATLAELCDFTEGSEEPIVSAINNMTC